MLGATPPADRFQPPSIEENQVPMYSWADREQVFRRSFALYPGLSALLASVLTTQPHRFLKLSFS